MVLRSTLINILFKQPVNLKPKWSDLKDLESSNLLLGLNKRWFPNLKLCIVT